MLRKTSLVMAFFFLMAVFTAASVSAADYAPIVKLDSYSNNAEPAQPPENMIDGSESTRWGSMAAGDWAIVELDKAENISAIDMMLFKVTEPRPYVFSLEYSSDGATWTDSGLQKTDAQTDSSLQPAGLDIASGGFWDSFPLKTPVSAKFWRLTLLGRRGAGDIIDTTGPASIWEIRFELAAAGGAASATTTGTAAASTTANSPVVTAPKPADPQTGDMSVLLAVISALALVGAIIVVRKSLVKNK